jgi:hypothetical protein
MTSIDVEFPPVPQLSSADEIQVRRSLRRNRLLATGLLALMILIAIATRFVPSPGWLVQLVRAGAEAGIIGGLADWFAITVLFRHPLGIPLPHTAILPSNRDRIGRSLGSFVERNFLVPEVSSENASSRSHGKDSRLAGITRDGPDGFGLDNYATETFARRQS